MSTVHPPPPSTAGQRSHPIGFNDQTNFDPFFPSSPGDEFLVAIGSDHSPSHHSYHTLSPPQASNSNNDLVWDSTLPSETYSQLQLQPHTSVANGFDQQRTTTGHDPENKDDTYDFLSPHASETNNGYHISGDHTTTSAPGSDDFFLEASYLSLVDQDQDLELNDLELTATTAANQLQFGTEVDENTFSTYNCAGTATRSSHLMSPGLTDPDHPTSRYATNSPAEGKDYVKNEASAHMTGPSFMQDDKPGNGDRSVPMQVTPSLTESSKGTSPELSSVFLNTAHTPSPMIRIDGYSRGDSPSRGVNLPGIRGKKRSRAGSNASHLSVQQDQEYEVDTISDDRSNGLQHAVEDWPSRSGLGPTARQQIGDVEVANFKEQDVMTQVTLKNIDVEEWLGRSENGRQETANTPPRRPAVMNNRQRAKSTGTQTLSYANLQNLKNPAPDSHIPGPGILIDEESGNEEEDDDDDDFDDDDDDDDGEDIASIEDPPSPTSLNEHVNDIPGEAMPGEYDELPRQPPLYRAKLWQDPLHDTSDPGVKMQPETAMAAMRRYEQRAGDIDAVSRVATWGTRRMSESDLNSLFNRFTFSEKTQEPVKEKRERRGSFLQQLSGRLSSRKSSTNLKHQDLDMSTKPKEKDSRQSQSDHNRKDSQDSRKDSLGVPQASSSGLKRMSSLNKRPKSPRINTGSAVAAMAFQAGALGAGRPVSATGTSSPTGWPKNLMKRSRNNSELNNLDQGQHVSSTTDLGLTQMWTQQGGPPMPALVAPPLKTEEALNTVDDGEEDDEGDANEDHGISMDLSIRSDPIIPTLEGFKTNIRSLNPRLPGFMFDRIAQEQLRRFKKLMEFKVKHVQAVNLRTCASKDRCPGLGGSPTYLPSRSSAKEAEVNQSGLTVAGLGQSDDDSNALAEGVVTPAQFPQGVLMPPVQRLPAEFECSLCFKVKKFHKPSDWSKHVHEDVQPFTCTFQDCAEPKSFKRKADWVRHENERHRQLEWWVCNMNDCSHKCYRKDNFVQHLVREHKLPEPKVKNTKDGKPAVRGPSCQKARGKHANNDGESNEEIDQVWKLVDDCRHETHKNPRDESCKFCGNVCNSWKKLTVHLAKHMEQISMPVLTIVKLREVTPDTIISPIEQRLASQRNSLSPTVRSPFSQSGQPDSVSQYAATVAPFTPLQPQSGYFAGATPDQQMAAKSQRASPATYPPPRQPQQVAMNYHQDHSGRPYVSNYALQDRSAAPTFNQVNAYAGFSHPQTSSPDEIYGGSVRGPTSQPRATSYTHSNNFQYVSQQQPNLSSPVDGEIYPMSSTTAPLYTQQPALLPTSYPAQQQLEGSRSFGSQQQASMGGQRPMVNTMYQYPQQVDDGTFFNQQQRYYGYQR